MKYPNICLYYSNIAKCKTNLNEGGETGVEKAEVSCYRQYDQIALNRGFWNSEKFKVIIFLQQKKDLWQSLNK